MSSLRHILAPRSVTAGGAILVLALAIATSAGCGGNDGGGDDAGGSDAGGTDAGDGDAGTRDDGGSEDAGAPCPEDESAAIDTPCEREGQVCGGPCTDACSSCNLIRCVEGRWQRMEVFPAPCFFACGDSLQCLEDTEYCYVVVSGPAGSEPSYECQDTPEECGGTASCDCISLSAEATCDDSTEGQVTVEVAAP